MKYLFLLLLIISLKVISTKRKNEEINCNLYKDCFTCSTCNDITLTECQCMWTNNSCESTPTKLKYTKEWWNKFNLCKDNNSLESQNIYCGYPIKKNENSKNTIITYPEINSHYGKKFLYCKYEYDINRKENDYILLKIQMNKLIEDNLPLIGITFEYENEFLYHLIYDIGTDSFDDLKFSKADIVNIHLFSFIEYSSNPIIIEFDLDKNKKKAKKAMLIILIILSILIIILSIIIVYLYLYKRKKEDEIKDQSNILKHRLRYRLNYLNKNKKIFSDEELIENKCCFCNEDFINQRTEIFIIPCKHVCHYECLKDKIEQNSDIECKVCHFDILEFIDNDNNYIFNNDNNFDNNNISVKTDNTLNRQNNDVNDNNQNNNIKNTIVPSIYNSQQKGKNLSHNNMIPRNSKDPFASDLRNSQK